MHRKLKNRMKRYIRLILKKSERSIDSITIIGSLVNGNFNKNSDINIVICFEPDFSDDWEGNAEGYKTVFKLRKELINDQKRLKIKHPIDLGWIAECGDIFLGGGLASNYRGNYVSFVPYRGKLYQCKKSKI